MEKVNGERIILVKRFCEFLVEKQFVAKNFEIYCPLGFFFGAIIAHCVDEIYRYQSRGNPFLDRNGQTPVAPLYQLIVL